MTPTLCILQARYQSTRMPHKMLAMLGGETLIERGWRIACTAFGADHCVVAIPQHDEAGPLGEELRRIGARIFAWSGDESDVLSRFHACAHTYRWRPDSVLVRYTPDDPFKTPDALTRVADGERLPVELGGEAFTLEMLDAVVERVPSQREHLSPLLYLTAAPDPPAGQVWTIDTPEDLAKAEARVAGRVNTSTKGGPESAPVPAVRSRRARGKA